MKRHLTRASAALATLVIAALTAPLIAQPANDQCSGATPLAEGEFTFDLNGASPSVPGSCDDPGAGGVADLWYRYVASGTGDAIVTTCGLVNSFFGTTVTVYSRCDGPEVACNSNACGEGQSTVSFHVVSGHDYLIRLASADGRAPNGSFRVTLVERCNNPRQGAPANDCCSTATAVGNGRFAFTTAGASRDYAGACDQLNPNPDVWFNYTAPTTGFSRVRPDTDAPQDLGITILSGSARAQVACGGDFLFEGDTRQVVFPTVAGTSYLIRLHGVTTPVSAGHILVGTVLPPVNDGCLGATPISGVGMFPFDNTLADNSGPDDGLACDGFGGLAIAHDVWFRWTDTLAPGQDVVISTCGGTRVDTKIAVYENACPPGSPLDCNDDFCFGQSHVLFTPTPGGSYLIRIGNWPGFNGDDGPDGKPGIFTISAQPTCIVTPPPGAFIEPELCGQRTNDGCDVGASTMIACGTTTIFGVSDVTGGLPDLDLYTVVLPVATHVSFTGIAEFPMALAILDDQCPANVMVRWRFPAQPCDDPTLNPLEIDLDAGTYSMAVANTRADSPCGRKNNYLLTLNVNDCEPSGRCCVSGQACQVTHQSACTAAGGAYAGDFSTCPPPGGNYTPAACAEPIEDISALGAPGPACDDCGQAVDIGFSFTFYGQAYTTVHVSSNGFLTFSDQTYDGAANHPSLPNPFFFAMIAPWWTDLDPTSGAGRIYTATLGDAPNRRFVALWKDVETIGAPETSSTFEAVLFEGSNQFAFRYGALDPAATATIGVDDGAGVVGATYDRTALGSCSRLTLTIQPDPCAPCPADYNRSGAVTIQDIFDFLVGYFINDPRADINHLGGVTVQDIFDFLVHYFAGC